jgi:hypothetical protein
MTSSIDTLHVASWCATSLPETLVLTRFMMPVSAHEALVQWCREKTRRDNLPTTVVIAGLSEVLAFFAPETAYMAQDRDPGDNGLRRQCLYFIGDVTADAELLLRLQSGILIWLGIIYPEKDAGVRTSIAESVIDRRNWRLLHISTRLKEHDGPCPSPQEGALFDALTAHVVAQLANKMVQFTSGESRILIPGTPQSKPFGGVELVAFPPKKERDGDGFYTEVVTISAATFPEQNAAGIQILALPSIRNWGPVKGFDRSQRPSRSLDMFMPPQGDTDGYLNYRHTSFGMKVIIENMDAVKKLNAPMKTYVRWEAQRDHRIVDLMRRLSGSANKLEDADYTHPIIGHEGLWILPRLSPGSGDRYLAGGSGVGWNDRNDIAESLDAPMEAAGLTRAEPMTRIKRQLRVNGPFNVPGAKLEVTAPQRRAGLLNTLSSIGNPDGEVDFVVFHMREGSPDRVKTEVKRLLGAPNQEDDALLTWSDGLKVRLIAAPSGPLGQMLEYHELPEGRKDGLTQRQQDELRKAGQRQSDLKASIAMRDHVLQVRAGRMGVACAILEMASSVKGTGSRDPYALARQNLARQRVLPQVVLVDDEAPEEKYRSAVRDWFRMLGVLPAFEQRLPLLPAAFTVIQRNDEVIGGGLIKGQAFPLGVRVREGGTVECALPDESGVPNWMPYALAALRIYSGDYGKFARNRTEENLGKFGLFFTTALEQIDRLGASLVILDMDTVANKIPALNNGNLAFDRLQIGNQSLAPEDFPNTRIIRVCANTAKLPCYMQTEGIWPQGLFNWASANRTAYGVKKKPPTAKTVSYASKISRHLPPGDNRAADSKPRRIAALDEICVIFKQPGDDAVSLLMMSHRLRSVHAQVDNDTSLPFPLHELRLLGDAVTS